jgi:hypothetical protein
VPSRLVLSFLLAAFTIAATVMPAAAQTAGSSNPFVIHALAGLTFGGPSGGVFGAGAGAHIAAVPGLTVFGEFGRLTNVMTSDLEDLVNDLVKLEELEEFTEDFEFEVRLPTTYGLAGARFDVVRDGPINVFVEGGLGFARVGLDVTLIVEGEDVSDDFRDLLQARDVASTTTEALLVIGGGVAVPITPNASVIGGIRINRIAMGESATKPAAYVGVHWRP